MKKLIICFILVALLVLGFFGYKKYKNNIIEKAKVLSHNKLIKDIKNNYNKTVTTKKDTSLYLLKEGKYIESGSISKDFYLEIEKLEKEDDPYYKISSTDYYISYKDVKKADEEQTDNQRYKYFIPFDNNVVIKPDAKIFLDDDSYIKTGEEINVPLIVNDTEQYGFEYLNRLFYVNKDDAELQEHHNSDDKKAKKVLTITYHFIYDPEEKSCNQDICQSLELFESHLKFLTENNYFVMRLNELEMYLDGKVNIPYNSIVLTIDDGHISEKAIRLLEQYKTYATLFVITNHFDDFSKFQSPYLDLQSHTDSMHKQWACGSMGQQGGGLLCTEESKAIEDLKTSQEKLGGADKVVYLSYPFFDFNDHAIQILKKAGFRMAFIGQWNTKGFSTVGTDKYKIPRLTVFNNTTVDVLKKALAY